MDVFLWLSMMQLIRDNFTIHNFAGSFFLNFRSYFPSEILDLIPFRSYSFPFSILDPIL